MAIIMLLIWVEHDVIHHYGINQIYTKNYLIGQFIRGNNMHILYVIGGVSPNIEVST